ncbi:hypothetical protein PR202_gb13592 [Eleusine coracana subsp. coracana]|uniref:Plastocyanin-like domain-containing protein n=1 Tax=Eleusine coracana subsp. coracana TaxID=191504 RepID=A0AAV5ESE6_ELECO|nr:hypothetical protein PR202_gb13592 [Eleusine coracana subsp. coracana]
MGKLSMAASILCMALFAALLATVTTISEAAVVEHTFYVHEMNVTHLCNTTKIYVVNGQFPARRSTSPTANGGGHVINRLDWRTPGPLARRTLWFAARTRHVPPKRHTKRRLHRRGPKNGWDGPSTLSAHAGQGRPHIIARVWQLDLIELDRRMADGNFDDTPQRPSTRRPQAKLRAGICGREELRGRRGEGPESYLLRVINTGLFLRVLLQGGRPPPFRGGADGKLPHPYRTHMVVGAGPGEAIDVLLADAALPGLYHNDRARDQPPEPNPPNPPPSCSCPGVGRYRYAAGADRQYGPPRTRAAQPTSTHKMPVVSTFHNNLTGLGHNQEPGPRRRMRNARMFITLGLGSIAGTAEPGASGRRSNETIVVATMNNAKGVYTEDFPDHPPRPYNYTNRDYIPPGPLEEALEPTFKATKLRRFKYNTSVEIVFQSTALLQSDSNPMHLHGYDFFVLAQGIGNFDPKRDVKKFNYHNPQLRNTVQVPRTGWAAIRFVTDNPGMWYLHCHFEFHIVMGMATAFIVEDGPTPETSLPPPPPEYKRCSANGLMKP